MGMCASRNKTYIKDCIRKKVIVNTGERAKYYVENNHSAIIDADTFALVQEELARRASKRKVKQVGSTTEQGKYCGKYSLTELLVCGESGTPYRQCTWTAGGEKRMPESRLAEFAAVEQKRADTESRLTNLYHHTRWLEKPPHRV